jgi:hypothetical protein
MDTLDASLLVDDLRYRCLVAAASYRPKTEQEPYRLGVEERSEVTVVAARKYFRLAEAAAKVDTWVETLVAFFGVPKGTTGAVVHFDEAASGFDVGIQGELPERRTTLLVDWFSNDAYEEFLHVRIISDCFHVQCMIILPSMVASLSLGQDGTPRGRWTSRSRIRPLSVFSVMRASVPFSRGGVTGGR